MHASSSSSPPPRLRTTAGPAARSRKAPAQRFGLRSIALVAALLGPALAPPGAARADAPAPTLHKPQAGYYRLKVGAIDVTALSDGTVKIDSRLLTHVDPAVRDALLQQAFVSSPLDASVNAFLIELGPRRILIDCGTGELYGPTLNKLPAVLRAIGTPPEQITDILLTHIHTDHSGGLMDGDRRVFPNAMVHVEKRELAYWLNAENAKRATPAQRHLFDDARRKVKPYVDAGRVQTFDGATQLFPGLSTEPAWGHTPGHTFYVLESNGEKLAFWGDILHVAEVQLPDPSVTIVFDDDPSAAARQRAHAFAAAARGRYLVAPAHMSFPGIGHLRIDGAPGHYRWIPLAWVDDAVPPGSSATIRVVAPDEPSR